MSDRITGQERMLPGQEPYTLGQAEKRDEMVRSACEAEETFDLDTLEQHKYDLDQENRATLKKRNLPDPGDVGLINQLRWNAGRDEWYFETSKGKVYWLSGKEGWKYCPHGSLDG